MKIFCPLFLAILLPGSSSNPDEDRLLKHLLDPNHQRYNVQTTPVASVNESILVIVGIGLRKLIALEEVDEVLKLQYWMLYNWIDYRLQWNASDFGGIALANIHASKMWKPDLLLNNNAKVTEGNEITPQSNVVFVYEDGSCSWEPRYEESVSQCHVDVTWFPFDEQECELVFESWTLLESTLKLYTSKDEINLLSFRHSDTWHLLGVDAKEETTVHNFSSIIFTLRLRRKPLFYIMNLIVPCCLLSFVVVATFVLQPSCVERLGLAVTVVLAMSVYQIIVSSSLPATSASTPLIVIYFLFVIAVSVFSVLVTIVILHMYLRAENKPVAAMPAWVKRLFCQKLARCLCMKPAPSPSLDPTLICRKSLRLTAGNSYTHSPPDDAGSAPSIQSTENDTAKELLKEIRDLLKSQVHKQKEQCYEDEREEEMKQDWMLAAAVIDRICAITFAIFTIGGTLVFYILFAIHP